MATQVIHPAEQIESIDTSRFECIDGKLEARPLPGLTHSRLQNRVRDLIKSSAGAAGLEALAELSIDKVDGSRSDWMTPDVLVSSDEGFRTNKRSDHVLPPALLAVEVLSPGQTFHRMRLMKADRYLNWGIAHVWLVDSESKSVLTFEQRSRTQGRIISGGEISIPGLAVQFSDIFDADS